MTQPTSHSSSDDMAASSTQQSSSDVARIEKLLEEGKISPAEADMLLAALKEAEPSGTVTSSVTSTSTTSRASTSNASDEAYAYAYTTSDEANGAATGSGKQGKRYSYSYSTGKGAKGKGPQVNVEVDIEDDDVIGKVITNVFDHMPFVKWFGGDDRDIPEPPEPPEPGDALQSLAGTSYEGLPWLVIRNRFGNLRVKLDSSLTAPEVEDVREDSVLNAPELEQDGTNYTMNTFGNNEIGVPEGYAVFVVNNAGNVKISNLPVVFARVNAGNVTVSDVQLIMMRLNAGNAKIRGQFNEGQNALRITGGNAKVTFAAGSSVTVQTSVKAGDIGKRGTWDSVQVSREMMGGRLQAQLAEGNAKFNVVTKAGNITLVAVDDIAEDSVDDDLVAEDVADASPNAPQEDA
ncbi:MAG: hypothetical protein AAF267_18750 [Deinococcota bacterium]